MGGDLGPPSSEARLPVLAEEDRVAFGREVVRRLRAAAARYPGVAEVEELVDGSAEFSGLWAAHEVSPEPSMRETLHHPLVGALTLNCDALDISERDQRVVIYTAEPGSPDEEALRLIFVVGTQRFAVPG